MAGDNMSNPPTARAARGTNLRAAALIGVPVIALLAVPLYARTEPVVLDFPMFYWWTCLWIAALSAGIGLAFRIIQRAESTRDLATSARGTEVGQ
jgi:hypothetical protein